MKLRSVEYVNIIEDEGLGRVILTRYTTVHQDMDGKFGFRYMHAKDVRKLNMTMKEVHDLMKVDSLYLPRVLYFSTDTTLLPFQTTENSNQNQFEEHSKLQIYENNPNLKPGEAQEFSGLQISMIYLNIEHPTLQDEYNFRIHNKFLFDRSVIRWIALGLIKGMNEMKQQGVVHGNISMDSVIKVSEDQFKVQSPYFRHKEGLGFVSRPPFTHPDMITTLEECVDRDEVNNIQTYLDVYKCDVYSIGIILLLASTLSSLESIKGIESISELLKQVEDQEVKTLIRMSVFDYKSVEEILSFVQDRVRVATVAFRSSSPLVSSPRLSQTMAEKVKVVSHTQSEVAVQNGNENLGPIIRLQMETERPLEAPFSFSGIRNSPRSSYIRVETNSPRIEDNAKVGSHTEKGVISRIKRFRIDEKGERVLIYDSHNEVNMNLSHDSSSRDNYQLKEIVIDDNTDKRFAHPVQKREQYDDISEENDNNISFGISPIKDRFKEANSTTNETLERIVIENPEELFNPIRYKRDNDMYMCSKYIDSFNGNRKKPKYVQTDIDHIYYYSNTQPHKSKSRSADKLEKKKKRVKKALTVLTTPGSKNTKKSSAKQKQIRDDSAEGDIRKYVEKQILRYDASHKIK